MGWTPIAFFIGLILLTAAVGAAINRTFDGGP
jgi:hypothetical protein